MMTARMRRRLALPLLALLCVIPSVAVAQVGIRVEEVPSGSVRVDGSLRDWRGVRFDDVGSGDDASMRYALRYDGGGLYVAAVVSDDRMVRTARPGPDEDAIVLTLAMPAGRGWRGVDLWLYAGVPGRQAASAAIGPVGGRARPLPEAQVVEGPSSAGPGYVLEAYVPFRAIPGSARWEDGRAAIRLRDVDSEARPEVKREVGTATVDPRSLDRLPQLQPTGGARGMLRQFLRSRGLEGTRPRHDLRGDVQGDGRPERIMIVEHYVLVMGPGYRDGAAFDFLELPVPSAAGVRDATLMDLTGDRTKEVVITLRQSNALGSRDVWMVYSVGEGGLAPIFGVEIRKETRNGFVEARLRVRRARRGAPHVEVVAGESHGLDASNLRESPPADVQPILVPWGDALAKTWQWDGERFALVSERENPAARRADRQEPSQGARPRREEPEAPATAPSTQELIAAFKQQARLPARARPSHRQRANLAEGREPEDALIFGTHLLVVGPGFRGGTGWFHFELPVADARDVLSFHTADLTGDGREELVFRIRRRVDDVTRELLLIHQFRPSGFPRILAAEVAREQDGRRIESEVRLRRGRGRHVLEIGPGRARGWDASSYPFADGSGDDVDPLLLPWRDAAVRYTYRAGDRLRR